MADSGTNSLWESSKIRIVGLVLIIAGMLTRLMYLTADPPSYFKNTSRAILTDPYNLTYFARNKVLFGSWDIFDYNRWVVFKYSLASFASYIWFSLFGVSRLTANLSAVTLSMAGAVIFCAVLFRASRSSSLIAGVVLFSTMVLNLFGRYPFLENGLIFLSALLFLVSIKYGERVWGLIVAGVLTSLCILSGKLFGLVMGAPVLAMIWAGSKQHRIKNALLYTGAFGISLVLLAMLFYGQDVSAVWSYIAEQTTGMYGPPEALHSPVSFVEQMLTLGGSSMTFHFIPVLAIWLFLVLAYLLMRPDIEELIKNNRELLFCLAWLIAGALLLSFPNYRPLRYQLFLLLPVAGIIGIVMTTPVETGNPQKIGWMRISALVLISWYFCEQLIIAALRPLNIEIPGLAFKMVWYCLPVTVLVTGLFYYLRRGFVKYIRHRNIFLYVIMGLFIGFQYQWTYRWFSNASYTMARFSEDTYQTLGENAVVTGPFAQTLVIDNDLKSFIYMFGLTNREPNLFSRYPLTHLAVDQSNWDAALKDYPVINGSQETLHGTMKYLYISMVRVPDTLMQLSGSSYKNSDYETAFQAYAGGDIAAAEVYLNRFLREFPDNRHGLLLGARLYFNRGNFQRCMELLERGNARYHNDYGYLFEAAYIFYSIYLAANDNRAEALAEDYFGRSLGINPDLSDVIGDAKAKLRTMFRK